MVVQHAPAVSVTLGEEFGVPPGHDVVGAMTAALRHLGFKRVFDTGFTADLTIMEEGSELVHRLKNGGRLPMLTSCSPGWIKFVESFYPEFLENLSTCKSPQQMMGAVIKSYFAQREGIDPAKIFSVSVMPCTAKKFEAGRPEMTHEGLADIDCRVDHPRIGAHDPHAGSGPSGHGARNGRHALRRTDFGRQTLRGQRRRDGSGHPQRLLPCDRQGNGRSPGHRGSRDVKGSRKLRSRSTASSWAWRSPTGWATPQS